ncbi:hypothetical protein ACHAXT_012185 [Thalassiosira profunda]
MAIVPNDNDVLLGRGFAIMCHPGNELLREMVRSEKPAFLATPRAAKRDVARSIVRDIQRWGGRFLVEDPACERDKDAALIKKRGWLVAEEERAVEKVMHRLREKDKKGGVAQEGVGNGGVPNGVGSGAHPGPQGLQQVPSDALLGSMHTLLLQQQAASLGNAAGIGFVQPNLQVMNGQNQPPVLQHRPTVLSSEVPPNPSTFVPGMQTSPGLFSVSNGDVSQSAGSLPALTQYDMSLPTLAFPPTAMNTSPVISGINGELPESTAPNEVESCFYYLKNASSAEEFPMSVLDFVKAGGLSHGIALSKQEAGLPGNFGGSGTVIETATRLALVLTRLFASSRSEFHAETFQLRDFVLTVDLGFDEGNIEERLRGRVLLRMDALAPARAQPKQLQGTDASEMQALGKLLYSVFALGQAPPDDLSDESPVSSAQGDNFADVFERSATRFCGSANAVFPRLVEDKQFPVTVCRLLSDLLDVESNTRFASFEDVVQDLQEMISRPQIFLHDSDQQRPPPVFGHGQASYGRKEEVAILTGVTSRVEHSLLLPASPMATVEAVFVSGMAGSGKSHLMHALEKNLPSSNWVVIKAKFERGLERASRQIVASMFDQLVSFLVKMKQSDNPLDVAYCQQAAAALVETIGYGRLSALVDFLPSLPLLFGGVLTNEATEMHAEDAQWCLIYSIAKIVEAVLSTGRLVMICCDDLQWGDKETLSLISEVLVNVGSSKSVCGRCLFVGLYRNDEIDSDHPFSIQHAYLQMMTSNVTTTNITLSSLLTRDMEDMLMVELRLTRRMVRELADVVHKKTSGHALFVVELLNSLLRNSTIAYSPPQRRFDWDIVDIEMLKTGENVAELIASNLSSMSPAMQRSLQILSLFGTQTDYSLLQLLEKFQGGIVSSLDTFIEQGILDRAGPIFLFTHDLIQQAAFESIPLAERPKLRLLLGEFLGEKANIDISSEQEPLSRGMDKLPSEDDVFFMGRSMTSSLISLACDQVNFARPNEVTDGTRVKFAGWNLVAGKKAFCQTNAHAAQYHFASGISLLGQLAWQKNNHYLSIALFEGAVSASAVLGEPANVLLYAEELALHATFEDTIVTQAIVLQSLSQSGRHEECLLKGMELLRKLKFDVPSAPSPESLMKAIGVTEQMAANFGKEQLLDLCEKEVDVSVHNVVKLLDAFYVSCYVSSSPFLPIVACIIMQFSFQQGICPEAPVAFSTYAMLKIFLSADYGGSRYWADRSMEMEAKHRSLRSSSESVETTAQLILYVAVEIWFEPPRAIAQKLMVYHQNALKSGQMHVSIPALGMGTRYQLLGGENLALITQTYMNRLKLAAKHSLFVGKYMALDSLLLTVLTGESEDYFSVFEGGSIAGMQDLQEVAKSSRDLTLLQSSHVFNVLIEFWRGNYSAAEEHSAAASAMFPQCKEPTIYLIYLTFFRGLLLFSLYRKMGGNQRLKDGKEMTDQMGIWTQNAKDVFENKWLLLAAEAAASTGEHDAALTMYLGSIEASRDHGNVHELALGYELLGDFHASCGRHEDSRECIQSAYTHYTSWGASAVANKLLRKHNLAPDLQTLNKNPTKRAHE